MLAGLAKRLNVAAAQVAPTALLSNKSWRDAMDDYGRQISETTAQRASLDEQLNAAMIAGVSGDPAAERRADDLDNAIVAVDRKLGRLTKAQTHAAGRLAAKEAAEAEVAERKRLNAVKRQVGTIHTKAHEAQQKLAEFAAVLGELSKEITTLRGQCGPELHSICVDYALHMPVCVNAALHEVDPLRFNKQTFLPPDRISISDNAARCFEAEHAAGLAQRHKGIA